MRRNVEHVVALEEVPARSGDSIAYIALTCPCGWVRTVGTPRAAVSVGAEHETHYDHT